MFSLDETTGSSRRCVTLGWPGKLCACVGSSRRLVSSENRANFSVFSSPACLPTMVGSAFRVPRSRPDRPHYERSTTVRTRRIGRKNPRNTMSDSPLLDEPLAYSRVLHFMNTRSYSARVMLSHVSFRKDMSSSMRHGFRHMWAHLILSRFLCFSKHIYN